MFVTDNISIILYVIGAITLTPLLQYFLPRFFLNATIKTQTEGPVGLFYAQGWGLAVGATGLLLIYAGGHEEGRDGILMAVGFAKAAFVALVLSYWGSHAFARGHAGAVVFDIVSVALFALYLTGTL